VGWEARFTQKVKTAQMYLGLAAKTPQYKGVTNHWTGLDWILKFVFTHCGMQLP